MAELILDNNISSLDEDKLGRGAFVKTISNYLKEQLANNNVDRRKALSKSSIVLGLYGEWGTGKTSVLNCLDNEIKSTLSTVWLNPWIYKSQEQIVLHLLKSLVDTLQLSDDESNKLKGLMAKLVSGANGIAKSVASTATGGTTDVLVAPLLDMSEDYILSFLKKEEENLFSIKAKINSIFENTATPIVMFIDDVDRLSNSELITLFKTIRMLADFSNVCYILAFDEIAVAKSIKKQYGEGTLEEGMNYIEKIITFPIHIPVIQKGFLMDFTISLINQEFELNDLMKGMHNLHVTTPRQAKRLANSYLFSYANLKDSIPSNLLLLYEIIKLHAPEEFRLLKELNKHNLDEWKNQNIYFNSLKKYVERKTNLSNIKTYNDIASELGGIQHEHALFDHCLAVSIAGSISNQLKTQRNTSQAIVMNREKLFNYLRLYLELENKVTGE